MSNPTDENCGNCKWHGYEDIDQGYVCCNKYSDRVADWTENDDWCDLWEGKGNETKVRGMQSYSTTA